MSKKLVIVPVDFSSKSLVVSVFAGQLAAAENASVILLHVVSTECEMAIANEKLLCFSGQLRFSCEHIVVKGDVVEAILEMSNLPEALSVVMANPGTRTLIQKLRKGTLEKIEECAGCPVIAITSPVAELSVQED